MQAASGWAPLSHAPRFAPVCICGCQRLCVCMWNGIRRRQGARLQVGTNRRIAASPLSRQSWPGCRSARSPGVVPRGPVTEPPGRCLAIEPLLCRPPGRLCGRPGRLRGESGPLARETEAGSRPKGACGSEANCGPRATRGSEAGRAFGLYCTNKHGRCACSGGQGRFPARGLLAVLKRFATWDSQRVSYIPWNRDGFRMPPMFGVE